MSEKTPPLDGNREAGTGFVEFCLWMMLIGALVAIVLTALSGQIRQVIARIEAETASWEAEAQRWEAEAEQQKAEAARMRAEAERARIDQIRAQAELERAQADAYATRSDADTDAKQAQHAIWRSDATLTALIGLCVALVGICFWVLLARPARVIYVSRELPPVQMHPALDWSGWRAAQLLAKRESRVLDVATEDA